MEVSQIIESIDISEYIGQFVDLEEKGGELWGLSPFKEENTPSFSVNPQKGFWYDFSAGFGGNILDFIMRKDDVPLRQAIGILKRYANISEQEASGNPRLEASRVARRYRSQVKPPAKSTAKILPPDYMDRFEFRRDKLQVWADEGIPFDVMRRFCVRYDAFDDRIVYPIRDYDGNIISVCGRTLDPDYKEKGLRKYTYFQSIGTMDAIYGYPEAKASVLASREFILFEGAKSVMKMAGWGYENAGALLTSHLSPNQFRFLIRLSSFHGVRVVFALDSDVDITKDKNIQKLATYAGVDWVRNQLDLLQPKDSPVDQGRDVWDKLYTVRRRLS